MVYMYTFVVTNMDSSPGYLIKFYCKRGLMENFIKESKSGFDFASVSSHTRIVNANRLQVHALAYNIFNWFRRLALSANMRKQRIDTVRLKLLKIAAKVVHSARYITFKLCSSCPYKNEFYETLSNIGKLNIQLEQQLLTNLDSLITAQNSATGILYPFWRLVERCLGYMGQFWDSWYSYQFRYCSVNNSGLIFRQIQL